ncbi:hypothetical protein AAT19DRAFT_13549 [Rhodotorula toruloides]|uniref:Secreted protein n=1 Tax=Rhodotorula toruloides TaxID=5286 RepID=A0A2T0ABV7_RHOTO|nr:hypothetical protein AAT19DRAFT_13549 [Rhodotorula toruloides]
MAARHTTARGAAFTVWSLLATARSPTGTASRETRRSSTTPSDATGGGASCSKEVQRLFRHSSRFSSLPFASLHLPSHSLSYLPDSPFLSTECFGVWQPKRSSERLKSAGLRGNSRGRASATVKNA